MSDNNILKEFFKSLNEQEKPFTQLLKDDRLGMILRSAVNELNLIRIKIIVNTMRHLVRKNIIIYLNWAFLD